MHRWFPGIILISLCFLGHGQLNIIKSHQLTLIGNSKYAADFAHFDYVNPDAPKGGILKLATTLNFDSLNPFTHRGVAPPFIYDSHARLMVRSADEHYSQYGFIAEFIEYPEDFSWVIFHLNPKARFSDDSPITSGDVVFSLNKLKEESSPFFKNLYRETHAKAISPLAVKFTFESSGPKAIALAGYLPVLSKHYWSSKSLTDKLTEAPVSSGPIRPRQLIKGKRVVYERVPNYWAADLPINKGRYNFDEIRIDVYRDQHAAIEGFKAGLYDLRYESDINQWQHAYQTPALKSGQMQRQTIELQYPPGMSGLVFNTRLDKFSNPKLREALALLFDFEWINQKLLHSDYRRSTSFFGYTALEAKGLPTEAEKALLVPFKTQLPATVFGLPVQPSVHKGDGNTRSNHRRAISLLQQAGWELKTGRMVHHETGVPLKLSILSDDYSQERLLIPYRKILKRVGIELDLQTVDKSLFRKRINQFDFELVNGTFWHSLFPGQEQFYMFSSRTAHQIGSQNTAGIQNPVIDHLLNKLVECKSYNDLIPVGRALDRVLLSRHYLIPKWHTRHLRMAYWNHIEHPRQNNLYWHSHHEWWAKPKQL